MSGAYLQSRGDAPFELLIEWPLRCELFDTLSEGRSIK